MNEPIDTRDGHLLDELIGKLIKIDFKGKRLCMRLLDYDYYFIKIQNYKGVVYLFPKSKVFEICEMNQNLENNKEVEVMCNGENL
jgi:hypothetical protein